MSKKEKGEKRSDWVKLAAITALLLLLTGILWVPALAATVSGNSERFNYYVKALEYGLKGLSEYFKFVIELFKIAVAG